MKRLLLRLCCILIVVFVSSCSSTDSDDNTVLIAGATVKDAPDIGQAFITSTQFNLASVGYEQSEYFLSGTASAFINTSELSGDGVWSVQEGEQADFTTRIIVNRPINSDEFNGTVIVEWLNVTAGFDTSPDWNNAHVELIRRGYAWVGVSAQYVGIYGSERSIIPFHLKGINPDRYADLEHPGDSFSYDIFSQAAKAIRNANGVDPLDGLVPARLLAFGESQSASRMATYVNALHLSYKAFDGYMIHSRGNRSANLSQSPLAEISTADIVTIREDIDVPVILFQSESDVLRFGELRSRQPDSKNIRLWEVPGTAHADYYTGIGGMFDDGSDPSVAAVVEETSILGFINCDLPMNSGPMHYVFNAAVSALDSWVRSGDAPAPAERLALTDDGFTYQFDAVGNVLGGIRTPYVDAPTALLSGAGQSGESFCVLFGTTQLLSGSELIDLYGTVDMYVEAVEASTRSAEAQGYLLREDGTQIIEWAPQQWADQL